MLKRNVLYLVMICAKDDGNYHDDAVEMDVSPIHNLPVPLTAKSCFL